MASAQALGAASERTIGLREPVRRRFVWCSTAVLAVAVTVIAAPKIAGHGARAGDNRLVVEDPLDAHLRAARRAQEDARRCSGDLRALAARYPGATARVLEIDPVLIARALSHNGLSELSVETIQGSVDTIEQAARGIAGLRAGSPSVGTAHVAEAGAFSARAHRAADRLCEALEAVSAATLGSPALTRADLAGSAETIRP